MTDMHRLAFTLLVKCFKNDSLPGLADRVLLEGDQHV